MLWTLVAAGVALWLFEGRAWGALRLVPPHGWRLWVAVALLLVVGVPHAQTAARIARSGPRKRIKFAHPHAELLSPHTRTDLAWWVAASLSAGFGEEFVFRGYLLWAFQPWLGLWGAAAVSVIAFAFAHSYQGAKSAIATGVVGGLLTLVVVICGSLWPAVALHALTDIGQGVVAWLVARKQGGSDGVAAPGETASS
jgi:membrane protease YdiL (CAAX protease family)